MLCKLCKALSISLVVTAGLTGCRIPGTGAPFTFSELAHQQEAAGELASSSLQPAEPPPPSKRPSSPSEMAQFASFSRARLPGPSFGNTSCDSYG